MTRKKKNTQPLRLENSSGTLARQSKIIFHDFLFSFFSIIYPSASFKWRNERKHENAGERERERERDVDEEDHF